MVYESGAYKSDLAPGVHGRKGEKTYCSFCGKSVLWRKYSEHLDKCNPRKPELAKGAQS